jgi:hypothetical protein
LGQLTIAGDATSANLYVLDPDAEDENGDELICTVQVPPVHAFPGRMQIDALYLDCVPGVGIGSGASQDVDPQIALSWSQDGQTWSNELWRALGRQGQAGQRVYWHRLGQQSSHGRTYRLRTSANVVRGILQASFDGRVLAA